MKTDIDRHVRHCDECAKFRTTSKPAHKAPMKSVVTETPLQIVTMDFPGPLPKSDAGTMYALVTVDHFTRWPVVFPVQDTEAETVTSKIFEFICAYGCSRDLL